MFQLPRAGGTSDSAIQADPGLEEKWSAVTGRVVGIKSETDGGIFHIAPAGADGDKPGI